MSGTPPSLTTPSSPTPNKTRRSLTEIAAGGGDYLRADQVPPRGVEATITGVGWEPNYAKDAEIPCLTLSIGDEETKFKITTKANAHALATAGVSDDLTGAEGLLLYLQAVQVKARDGSSKVSIQIGEINKDGKRIYPQ